MEQETPEPYGDAPNFYIVEGGVTYRCWRLKSMKFLVDGVPAEGYYYLTRIAPPLNIVHKMQQDGNEEASEEDKYLRAKAGLTKTAYVIMTHRVIPYDVEYYRLFVPTVSPLSIGKDIEQRDCFYCGTWGRLLLAEEALHPEEYRKRQERLNKADEWFGYVCLIVFVALAIWRIGSFFHWW